MIHWGIVGCGQIAARMAKVLRKHPEARLYACAAREEKRAWRFADTWGAEKAYEGTEALAADPQVEAVYVANIHPAHYEAVKTCLLAGKPVLCEKPLTMTADQARDLFRLSEQQGILLMEAIWTRFLPAWREVRTRIEKGELGRIGYMAADFSASCPVDPNSRLFAPEKGGGALLDIGVYPLHMVQYILGPEYALGETAGRRASTGVDSFAAATLRFVCGAVAQVTCGLDVCGGCQAAIHGENGWIEVPRMYEAREYTVHWKDGTSETKVFEDIDGFTYEIDEFHRLLKAGRHSSNIAAPEHTLAVLQTVERIRERL